jgi:hypothetical protein
VTCGRSVVFSGLVSSTKKIDCHDITAILLKVTLNTITSLFSKKKKSKPMVFVFVVNESLNSGQQSTDINKNTSHLRSLNTEMTITYMALEIEVLA